MKLSQINEIQLHAPTRGMLRHGASGGLWAGSVNDPNHAKTHKKPTKRKAKGRRSKKNKKST